MNRTLAIFTTALILLTNLSFSQIPEASTSFLDDPAQAPRERSVDMTHLKLEVRFMPEDQKVLGTVTHTFSPLRKNLESIFVDAIDIKIKAAKLGTKSLEFSEVSGGYNFDFGTKLDWDKEYQLTISYEATPKRGIYFIGWNDTNDILRKQIWTQGQGIDNRHWIPCYDLPNDKLTTEVIIDFEDGYEVLSNGKLLSAESKDGRTKWHYKMKHPHTTYLMMLGIGKYAIHTSNQPHSKTNKLNMYYYPDQGSKREPTYRYMADIFKFMHEETGVDYPWGDYAQIPVQDFLYGAMENTTATIFTDYYYCDSRGYLDRNYVRVNAHEFAHQWFGDMITARSAKHHWLQESFATYYHTLYEGRAFGDDYYHWKRHLNTQNTLAADKKDLRPVAHSKAGTARHYPKGANVIYMLKELVGEEQFKKAINYYLTRHKFENVNSDDLLTAFHESLGYSLDWFWEQWVYRGGAPNYKIEFTPGSTAIFKVEQTQPISNISGLFDMPINFEIHYTDGSSDKNTVRIKNQFESVEFDTKGKEVAYALFDPNHKIISNINFDKSTEMLLAQAEKAENILDKYDALMALSNVEWSKKKEVYKTVWNQNPFQLIKTEIVKQAAANTEDGAAQFMLRRAVIDRSPKVRQAFLKHHYPIKSIFREEAEKLILDSSYVTQAIAIDKLCFQYPLSAKLFLDVSRDQMGDGAKNVRIIWLKNVILHKHPKALEAQSELAKYTSNSYEFRTRINAMQAWDELQIWDKTAMRGIFSAAVHWNSRLAGPAQKIIKNWKKQPAKHKLLIELAAQNYWSPDEKKKFKTWL